MCYFNTHTYGMFAENIYKIHLDISFDLVHSWSLLGKKILICDTMVLYWNAFVV